MAIWMKLPVPSKKITLTNFEEGNCLRRHWCILRESYARRVSFEGSTCRSQLDWYGLDGLKGWSVRLGADGSRTSMGTGLPRYPEVPARFIRDANKYSLENRNRDIDCNAYLVTG